MKFPVVAINYISMIKSLVCLLTIFLFLTNYSLSQYTVGYQDMLRQSQAVLDRGLVERDLRDQMSNFQTQKFNSKKVFNDQNILYYDFKPIYPIESNVKENDEKYYFLQANNWYLKGDYNKAIAFYTKGLEINPKDTMAYLNRAVMYLNIEQYDKAFIDLSLAIQLNESFSDAYYYRGLIYSIFDVDKALSDFTAAILADPNHYYAYCFKAYLLNEYFNNYRQGAEYFSNAIHLKPELPDAYIGRAISFLTIAINLGDSTECVNYLSKAIIDLSNFITIKPDFAQAYYLRANCRLLLDPIDLDMVLNDYNQTLKLDSNLLPAYYERGYIRLSIKDTLGACNDWAHLNSINDHVIQEVWYLYCNK